MAEGGGWVTKDVCLYIHPKEHRFLLLGDWHPRSSSVYPVRVRGAMEQTVSSLLRTAQKLWLVPSQCVHCQPILHRASFLVPMMELP